MAYDLEWDAGTITSMTSTGDEVEASLVNSFNKAEDALNELDGKIADNATQIDNNITNIATNVATITAQDIRVTSLEDAKVISDAKIASNTANITDNQDRIADLESLNVYEFSKVQGVSTTSNTYSPLNELLLGVGQVPAGTYELQFNAIFSYNTTNRSAYFEASDDGGVTWTEIRRECKDITDVNSFDFSYPYVHTGGVIHLLIQYRTENNGDVLNVSGCNLVVERKK